MDLSKEILQAVQAMGFKEPSTVQARTIPLMMEGQDINAIAPTGTGKTCAFGIPMLEYVQLKDSRVQEVVLAPTRELALQIGEELTQLAKFIQGVRIAVLYGGQSISKQITLLKRKPQIIIATPGRMLDHMQRRNISLDAVHTMVLDEADEMLNMGFVKDVTKIIEATPTDRQLVLFSATTNQDVLTIAWKYQHEPVEVTVEATKKDRPQITQYVISTEQNEKIDHLMYLLDVFSVLLAVILIYLLSKIIIEKNANSISMVKILGYSNREISSLYIRSTSVVVVLAVALSLPLGVKVIDVLWRKLIPMYMSGWMKFAAPLSVYLKAFAIDLTAYALVVLLEMRKIKKIPMSDALKNVE